MVLAIAVPTFAQVLPQSSDSGVTDPVAYEESVPNQDITSTDPGSATNDPTTPAAGRASDVIPIQLSSELCAQVTDPLAIGMFHYVVPELVQGCLKRASEPAGGGTSPPVNPAPVNVPGSAELPPADTAPADTPSTDTLPTDTVPTDTPPTDNVPTDTTSTDTAPADTAPADTGQYLQRL